MELATGQDAFDLIKTLGAPEHLQMHVTLVGEAADLVLGALSDLGVSVESEFVRMGVALHDIGKIIHTHEMTGPGSEHEPDGEALLLEKGVSPRLARCCMSHARWQEMECSLEELLIALSDKLWKGKRVEELELLVIDRIAQLQSVDRWHIYEMLDSLFESIAADGDIRLNRSVSPFWRRDTEWI
ncbi:HD domain-containing protein [Microbulbifer echini]|uniref:HD domain-containing protein n=1 Tax=Microbulbifer echini TaxID=1529067 RepID=A0ABV4NSZ1_9GAMM